MEILARAVGRRKEAVAQIQLVHGKGQFFINDKPAQAYLQNNSCSLICIKSPLQAALSLYSNYPLDAQSTEGLGPQNMKQEEQSRIQKVQAVERSSAPAGGINLINPKSEVPLPLPLGAEGEAPPFEEANLGDTNDSVQGVEAPTKVPPFETERFSQLLLNSTGTKEGISFPSSDEQLIRRNETKLLSLSDLVSLNQIDVIIKVKGGGLIGQAEAIKLGIARAFCIMENSNPEGILRKILKTKGYLTQDSRVKERRKYGLKKARKASQYHKR